MQRKVRCTGDWTPTMEALTTETTFRAEIQMAARENARNSSIAYRALVRKAAKAKRVGDGGMRRKGGATN